MQKKNFNYIRLKKGWLMLCFSIFVSCFGQLTVSAQNVEYITYVDNFVSTTQNDNFPIFAKSDRVSSRSMLDIKDVFETEIPDSVIRCIKVAQDLWKSKINSKRGNLVLKFKYEAIDDDIMTSVGYTLQGDVYYPSSLAKELGYMYSDPDGIDATITINKNTKWDCGFSSEASVSGCNLTNALLRSIAISLGFGSSITEKTIKNKSVIKFSLSRGHSVFDNLVFSDKNIYLKDIPNMGSKYNQPLIDFSTGVNGAVWVLNNAQAYKLYVPPVFEKGKSLVFLDNTQSLMNKDLSSSVKMLQIDTVTVNVLKALGWDITETPSSVKIKGVDIDESGLASAYSSHRFKLDGNIAFLSNIKWAFYLPVSGESEELVKEQNDGNEFAIPAIGDKDKYFVNLNGGVLGRVVLTGELFGQIVSDTFYVTLELKPKIKNVEISKIVSNEPDYDSYDVYFNVEYYGSDELLVNVEEEYGSAIASQIVKEPFFAHVKCSKITAPYYAWIDISVENKYGKDGHTIELPPYEEFQNSKASTTGLHLQNFTSDIIEVFDYSGKKMKGIKGWQNISSLMPGCYIIKHHNKNGNVKSFKYVIK